MAVALRHQHTIYLLINKHAQDVFCMELMGVRVRLGMSGEMGGHGWGAAVRGGCIMTAKELFCWALSRESLVCCIRAGSALTACSEGLSLLCSSCTCVCVCVCVGYGGCFQTTSQHGSHSWTGFTKCDSKWSSRKKHHSTVGTKCATLFIFRNTKILNGNTWLQYTDILVVYRAPGPYSELLNEFS